MPYNFTAQKNDGLKKATLKTQFLNSHHISGRTPLLTLEGEDFRLFVEEPIVNKLERFQSVKVIISYQWYVDGRKIAVARLHRDVPTTVEAPLAYRN